MRSPETYLYFSRLQTIVYIGTLSSTDPFQFIPFQLTGPVLPFSLNLYSHHDAIKSLFLKDFSVQAEVLLAGERDARFSN